MIHRKKGRSLSLKTDQRRRMLKNLIVAVILHERIITTDAKAKEVRRHVDRVITKGKINTLATRRYLLTWLSKNATAKVLEVLSPKYKDRNGGFTRIIKLGDRLGDGAKKVIFELV